MMMMMMMMMMDDDDADDDAGGGGGGGGGGGWTMNKHLIFGIIQEIKGGMVGESALLELNGGFF